MRPPLLAQAIIAAVTAPPDCESVIGDLCEEYALRLQADGKSHADTWYWSQALRSIPPLLSYSRETNSLLGGMKAILIVIAVLFAMLVVKDFVDRIIDLTPHGWLSPPLYFCIDWSIAALFGALLAAIVRGHGVRVAIVAALSLVAAFALPIVAGLSPPLPGLAWVLLLGAVPSMSIGAALYRMRLWDMS